MQVVSRSLFNAAILPNLVKDYLCAASHLREFYQEPPTMEGLKSKSRGRIFDPEDRKVLVEVLKEQYADLDKNDAVMQNLELMAREDVFTITTGHQLNILTGPLFFVYKLASAIALSRKLNAESTDRKYIPVYWMASEDHDKEEISSVNIPGEKLTWRTNQTGAVGAFSNEGINEIISSFRDLQMHLGGMQAVSELLVQAYQSDNLAAATRNLVNELFGEYGLIVIDANDPRLKKRFADVMQKELMHHVAEREVNDANEKLESLGYKIQVNPRPINLFYMHEGTRERIIAEEFGFSVNGTDLRFSENEILDLIENHPGRFSPNVILRPLYQETILPNVAYIGGPGELSYWLQLKPLFDRMEVSFPVLVERDHAILLNRQTMRLINKLGFVPDDLLVDHTSAVKRWSDRNHPVNLDEQKNALGELWEVIRHKTEEVDPTLGNMVAGEAQRQLKALENVQAKIEKAIRKREEDSIRQIESLWSKLYPGNEPQERTLNFFSFAADMDDDLLGILIHNFNPLAAEMKMIALDEQGFSAHHTEDSPEG